MANFNEIRFLKKIQKGNEKAFEEIFKEYYASLCVYANKFTLNPEISKEIVQSIFLKLWEKRTDLNIHTSLKSYLFRCVHNNSIKYLHSKKFEEDYRRYNEEFFLNKRDYIPDFDLTQRINKSIEELPPQCKKIFVLSRFDNLKHAEIAEILGISEKTVEVQIRRANISLRKKLNEFIPLIIIILVLL